MTKTLLRYNEMCFEYLIKDNGMQYQVLFCLPEYYSGSYVLLEKDGKGAPDELKTSEAIRKLIPKGCPESLSSMSYYRMQKTDAIKKNIQIETENYNSATSKSYKSYLAASILYDITSLPTNQIAKELTEHMDIFTNMRTTSEYTFLKEIRKNIAGLKWEMKSAFYCALAMKNDFHLDSSTEASVIQALKDGIGMKRTDLLPLLIRYPVFSVHDNCADFLMSQYGGAGLKTDELISYYIEKNKPDGLYESIMREDASALNTDNDEYSQLEILRYLCSHGYQDKKKEIAQRLILSAASPKEYFSLRALITKDELLEEVKSNRYHGHDMPLAYFFEGDQINDVMKNNPSFSRFYYYHVEHLEAYGYDPKHSHQPDDFEVKDARKEVREEINHYNPEFVDCYKTMVGLIQYNDKTSYTYLTNEDSRRVVNNGTFSIARAIAYETSGKKFKTMHLYKGGN